MTAFLDQAVRLTGHDICPVRCAHVQRLPAPPQRQRHHVGHLRNMRCDRYRALEAADGISEGLPQLLRPSEGLPQLLRLLCAWRFRCTVARRGESLAHHRGDDLCIGSDFRRNREAPLRDQVGVVVYVPVQHSSNVRAVDVRTSSMRTAERRIPRIERMGVRHRDDPDAGPARVPQHHHFGGLGAQSPAKQAVLANL